MYKNIFSSSICSLFLLLTSFMLMPVMVFFFLTNKILILDWTIFFMGTSSLNMMFLFDFVSLSFSSIVCLISGCVMMFSSSYMSADIFLKRFVWLVMLFVLSMNLLIFIPSLPALLLGWDGLGIVSFALVIYYQNNKSLGAGMLTVLANRVGDVMILISIGLMVLQGHWFIMNLWDVYLSSALVCTITIAAMTKSAQIPFSSWLPAAMAAPTPVSALVHSSTLVTAGVLLLIRFFPFFQTFSMFNTSILFIGVLTLLMAGIGANYEIDLKKIIALSTLSQLGVMMMSLGLNNSFLTLFHLYTHALFKALLFLCAGMIIHSSEDSQDIRSMGEISNQIPLVITSMNIANLSLCGAPFLSGFYSKDLILELSLSSPTNFLMLILIFLATGMTASYSLRLALCSLWSSSKNSPLHMKDYKDIYVLISSTILALMAIFAGFMLQSIFNQVSYISLIIPTPLKFLTITVIILGFSLGFILWNEKFLTKVIKKRAVFFSTMWFLALLSTTPINKWTMTWSTSMFKSVDQGWLEILGGQGTFNTLKDVSKSNSQVQIKTFNIMLLLMTSSAIGLWSLM